MADTNPSLHVVVVSSQGVGHVTPLAELAKLLVLRHHFTATLVTFSDIPCSLPSSISTVQLPIPLLDDLPSNTHFVTRVCLTIAHSVSSLREILISLRRTTRIAAVIFDVFGSDFLSMVNELGIPSYLFITSNYLFLSFMLHLPTLDETTTGEFRDLSEPLKLPGCVPLTGEDFLEPMQERESDVCAWLIHLSRSYDLFNGILVNSFEALEANAAKFYKQRGRDGKPHVLPIGPLTGSGSDMGTEQSSHKCIEWLNRQPSKSVVFICFGSGGTLSLEQTQELALGLEMSGQRFIWAVRVPNDTELTGSYFNSKEKGDDCFEFLPKGFVERTKDRGMMVPSWVPQREVLSHYATAGFVSHCGWNSTLESLVNGVPMITWPLYAEQRMNAVLLAEGVRVALKVKVGVNGVVRREEVAKVMKELMEGEEGKQIRSRMQEMKEEAAKAVKKEGSSYKAIEEMVNLLGDSIVA